MSDRMVILTIFKECPDCLQFICKCPKPSKMVFETFRTFVSDVPVTEFGNPDNEVWPE
jgi:hypothetical protein